MKFSYQDFSKQLPKPANEKWREGVWDVEAFQHGTMSLAVFAPRNHDYQTPHEQDELYFVMQGSGDFVVQEERIPFRTGDALFVAAGKPHHFENFTDDFLTWVVFWGPKGGE